MVAPPPLCPPAEVRSVVAAAMAAAEPPPVPALFAAMEEGPEGGGGAAGEAWLQSRGPALGHFVAGTWLKPPGRERLRGREEATGRVLCSVPGGDVGDLAAAVAAAMAAPWGGLGGAERGESLERLAGALEVGAATLGAVAALGTGRAATAASDLEGALRALREAAAGARTGALQGWGPLGVVAVVVPGPCPLTALMGTLSPILAMGNAALVLVLALPGGAGAALGPLLVAELGGAGGAAPLPPGVLNVVTGAPPLHRALRELPGVSAVTLLGETEDPPLALWGTRYLRGAPRGGHVTVIILESADLDSAAAAITKAEGRGGAGAPPRLTLLVLEALVPPLVRRLQARQGALRRGDPPNPHGWGEGGEPHLLPVRSVPEALSLFSALPPPAAASLWTQELPLALDMAQRLPMELIWVNALEVPQPWGGRSAIEMLRLFGRPPWAPPAPPLDEAPSGGVVPDVTLDPGDVNAALEVARRAAVGWGRLEASARARVLQGALQALRGGAPAGRPLAEEEDRLQGALRRWAARALLMGGAVKEAPGGRFLVTRRPLGVVGVAWSGPRPLRGALELLPPALACGNALVLVAPPCGLEAARRLQKALEAAGLPGGALSVLPGGAAGSGLPLARGRPNGLWLCGGDTDLDWGSIGGDPQVWVPGGGVLDAPPPDADPELELRCTHPHSLWLPLTPDL